MKIRGATGLQLKLCWIITQHKVFKRTELGFYMRVIISVFETNCVITVEVWENKTHQAPVITLSAVIFYGDVRRL